MGVTRRFWVGCRLSVRNTPTLSLETRERQGWGNLKFLLAGKGGPAPGHLPGERTIKITKAGYTGWEKKIKTSSGNVKIAAELQPTAPESK